MLDIGDEVGALVLMTDAALVGSEVEVSPLGTSDPRTHAEVHPRRAGGDIVHAAVFVQIVGGKVAELDRRTPLHGSRRLQREVRSARCC